MQNTNSVSTIVKLSSGRVRIWYEGWHDTKRSGYRYGDVKMKPLTCQLAVSLSPPVF